ncbi:hypothetical protein LXL04_011522 [Taraxacum kok-saghyz]
MDGFDEYMNLVLDEAEEVSIKKKTRKPLGRILLKGDNITLMMNFSLQTLKNKQSSSCRLQTFGPPLLLQRLADVVRRLQMFWLRKNKRHLNEGNGYYPVYYTVDMNLHSIWKIMAYLMESEENIEGITSVKDARTICVILRYLRDGGFVSFLFFTYTLKFNILVIIIICHVSGFTTCPITVLAVTRRPMCTFVISKSSKLSSSKSPFGDNSPSSLSTLWDPIVTDTWPTPPVSASNELISLLITGPLTAVNEPVDFFHKIWVSSKLQVKLLTWFGQMIILPTVWLLLEKIHTNDAVVYEVVVSLAVKGRSNHHPFLRQNPMIMWRQYPPTCSYSCPEVALVGLGKIPVASTVDFSQVTNEASDMVRADDNFTNGVAAVGEFRFKMLHVNIFMYFSLSLRMLGQELALCQTLGVQHRLSQILSKLITQDILMFLRNNQINHIKQSHLSGDTETEEREKNPKLEKVELGKRVNCKYLDFLFIDLSDLYYPVSWEPLRSVIDSHFRCLRQLRFSVYEERVVRDGVKVTRAFQSRRNKRDGGFHLWKEAGAKTKPRHSKILALPVVGLVVYLGLPMTNVMKFDMTSTNNVP